MHRKWVRDFELREHALRDRVGIIKQGAVGRTERHRLGEEIRETLVALDQIVNRGALPIDTAQDLRKRLEKVQRESNRILQSPAMPSALMALPGPKRRAYEHVIGLIYECSPNQAAAKLLVDRILARLK